MSVTLCVVGVVPADEDYKKKVAAYRACEAAGVKIPPELDKFFDYESPKDLGLERDLHRHACSKEFRDDYREGYLVDVTQLPPGTRYLRVYLSC